MAPKKKATPASKTVPPSSIKTTPAKIEKDAGGKLEKILQSDAGRDLICQFLEFFTLILISTETAKVDHVRDKVIYLRMAMRFGKVLPALSQMQLSLFHVTATISIALFLLVDNALFLWMNGLLPMSSEMAAIAGRLEL